MIIISTEQVPKSEQHSHAHRLLSQCLKEHGIDYAVGVTPVSLGKHGKPYLTERPELHYNISHAEGIAVAMVSRHECGIDCEPIRRYNPRVMNRVFSIAEREAVEAAPEAERELMFFRLWTLKEAYVKAIGKGLSFPFKEAAFAFEQDRIVADLKGCCFAQYIIDGKFSVSVCEFAECCESHRSFDLQMQGGSCLVLP